MVDKALKHRPEAKWFVFIEADTYLIWPNLLEYLAQFDASKSYYVGKHMYISNILFAYGGAGFAVSNPAMRKLTEHRAARLAEYDKYTAEVRSKSCTTLRCLAKSSHSTGLVIVC